MPILKAEKFADSTVKRTCFNLNDIAEEARRIIADAHAQSQQILTDAADQARADAQQTIAQAQKQGHEAGLNEGRTTGHQQALEEARQEFARSTQQTTELLQNVLTHFDHVKQQIIWQAEQNSVALALAIAEKIIKKAGLLSPEVTAENVRAALNLVNQTTDVIIRVSPQDLQNLQQLTDAPDSAFGRHQSITIEPDQSIEPGGCRIFTQQGEIDATLDSQITRIADQLMMTERTEQPTSPPPSQSEPTTNQQPAPDEPTT